MVIMRKITGFTACTVVASWLLWLPLILQGHGILSASNNMSALYILGALTPAVFGIIFTINADGREGCRKLMKSSIAQPVSWKWVLVSVLTFFVLLFLSRLLFSRFESDLPESSKVTSVLSFFTFTFSVFLVGGGLDEEIGWRGFLTRKLLERFRPVTVIAVVSVIWSIWHLPLFYIAGTNQASLGFFQFMLPVICMTVMITWLYYRTGSVLLCALFHTFGNVAHEVFRVVPTAEAPNPLGFSIYTGLTLILAVMIFILDVSLYHKKPVRVRNGHEYSARG